MANDVTADSLRDIPGGTLADGRNAKIRVTSSGPDISVAILVQEPGAVDYHGIGARVFAADDYKMVESILKSGGLWDQSWQDIEDGDADFTWGTNTQTGSTGVSLRFAYEVRDYSVRAVEQATDAQWFKGVFITFIQQLLDDSVLANPPTPLPPPVLNPYDPLRVGLVYQANVVAYMQATRLTLAGGVVGAGPIP